MIYIVSPPCRLLRTPIAAENIASRTAMLILPLIFNLINYLLDEKTSIVDNILMLC